MNIPLKKEITVELIKKHLTEYDILCRYWPGNRTLILDRPIESPFRVDRDPSFLIGVDDMGMVRYKDLGDSTYKGSNVFRFIQQLESYRSFHDVLISIDKTFNLGYSTGNPIKERISTTANIHNRIAKPPTFLQVTVRKFTAEELRWWNEWHIDLQDLKNEEIYAPKSIYRNRKLQPMELMTFCYYMPEIGRWKIYRPLAPKRTKDTPPHLWKWDNSIGRLDYIENLKSMTNAPVGIVNKARKDRIILRKATGINAICSIQAEDMSALSEQDLNWIDNNVKLKIAATDNDKKGKELSWNLTTERGYRHCNIPDRYLDIGATDWADYGKIEGLDAITTYWKNKGLI